MAFSWSEQVVPAGTTTIPVDIEYLDKGYIYLYLDGTLVPSSAYTWNSAQVIQLNAPVSTSTRVLIVRRTDKEYLYIMFAEGAAFIKENIDTQNTQFLHLAQELVEGRSIEGFYGDLSMNGYRITNLGDAQDPGDAVNKRQLDVVDARVGNLEQSVNTGTTSYPWYTLVTSPTDTFTPGLSFTKASVYLNGICQTPNYSYLVVDDTILLAEEVPAGTMVFARLGEDTDSSTEFVSTTAFVEYMTTNDGKVSALETAMPTKASKGANSDITSLSGLTTPLSTSQGGTGNNTGTAPRATVLDTPRAIRTNLTVTTSANFDGSADAAPGVTGVLGIANGGTGDSTAAGARAGLGLGDAATKNVGTATGTVLAGDAVGRLVGVQRFTANGTYTPTPGATTIIVEALGGGGAGGGTPATGAMQAAAGAGGNGGAYIKARGLVSALGASPISVVVGAGGAAVAGAAGGDGGATSLAGTALVVPGGKGGATSGVITPIAGGTFVFPSVRSAPSATLGAALGVAQNTVPQSGLVTTTTVFGSAGADTVYGSGGTFATNGAGTAAAAGYGAGGGGAASGASTAARAGGAGGAGVLIIYEYS